MAIDNLEIGVQVKQYGKEPCSDEVSNLLRGNVGVFHDFSQRCVDGNLQQVLVNILNFRWHKGSNYVITEISVGTFNFINSDIWVYLSIKAIVRSWIRVIRVGLVTELRKMTIRLRTKHLDGSWDLQTIFQIK